MNIRPNLARTFARAVVTLAAAASLGVAMAADPPAHLRGTIVSATATQLTVQTATGPVTIALDEKTKIAGIVPSSRDQIKEGTFVGIANIAGSGSSRAQEVVVFPEAMKGSGLGDYAWDLAPKSSGSAQKSGMTNGTVKAMAAASGASSSKSAMTNGTVKKASSGQGLVLTVDYGKGEKTIQVPSNVPIVTIVPADASKLVPGAHVFVAPKADAPTSAGFVAVGIDGTVPPM